MIKGKSWTVNKQILFLEIAIEKRIKALHAQKDGRFLTSINVVNRRLESPFKCREDLNYLKKSSDWTTLDFKEELDKIEFALFGAL